MSEISLAKAQVLWCTLNNKAVGQTVLEVSFTGEVIECSNSCRHLGNHFDRMLTYKTQVESTKLRCRKGMSVSKTMAVKGIKQRHLILLFQGVILSIIDYGPGLDTLSQFSLQKFDRVQSYAMRVVLGTTKDTSIEAMWYLLRLSPVETKYNVKQVEAHFYLMQNPKNRLHNAVKEGKGCRLARNKPLAGKAEKSIQHMCSLT